MAEHVWIVLPTYNERDNLEPLVREILRVVPSAHVLVVDDNSPDSTGEVAETLKKSTGQVEVLHRQSKSGLGRAYTEGFRHVLEQGAEYVLQLDADRSHPPSILPMMLERLTTHDLVIASRYVDGGRLDIPLHRRIVSQMGNDYIRFMLGRTIHDWSTGYKGWKASMLRQILPLAGSAVGYAWLIEMNWLAVKAGAKVSEVPMVFTERKAGHSKFTLGIIFEDIRLAWQLRQRGRTLAKKGKM